MIKNLFFTFVIVVALSSCYRMPTDEDYCVIPTTNNPDITRETGGQLLPSMSY